MKQTLLTFALALAFSHTLTLGMPAAAADLSRLSWLAGHWVSTNDDYAEEVWLAPRGGSMVGSFRWVFPDGKQVLEFLVIEADNDQVWFRFKHFGVDYEPWEKDAPNTYLLAEAHNTPRSGRALFERQGDNERIPVTLEYVRTGDTLEFTGTGEEGEAPLRLSFVLKAPSD